MAETTTEFRFGSDVQRDGVFLELDLVDGADRRTVCEVFYSDQDGSFTFTSYGPVELPLARIEEFIQAAHSQLPRSGSKPA